MAYAVTCLVIDADCWLEPQLDCQLEPLDMALPGTPSTWAPLGCLAVWLLNSKCEHLKMGKQKWYHLLRHKLGNQIVSLLCSYMPTQIQGERT